MQFVGSRHAIFGIVVGRLLLVIGRAIGVVPSIFPDDRPKVCITHSHQLILLKEDCYLIL